jgi:hypothetical protein
LKNDKNVIYLREYDMNTPANIRLSLRWHRGPV